MAVAQKAVEAYRDLHHRLVELGLKVNLQKTAFIATDRSTDKALRAQGQKMPAVPSRCHTKAHFVVMQMAQNSET